MRFISRALVGVLLLASVTVHAEDRATVGDVVSVLEQGYALLRDVKADFAQRTVLGSINREERGGGELFLLKGESGKAKFRFDYQKPQRQQIISDGRTVWFYLPDDKQVMVMDAAAVFEGGNAIALSYLTGMGRVSQDFNISFAGSGRDAKGNYVVALEPKKPGQGVAKLELTVSKQAVEKFLAEKKAADPFPIVASVVHDHLGNRTFLEFSKVKVNSGLSPSLFAFKIPKGVEVIKP